MVQKEPENREIFPTEPDVGTDEEFVEITRVSGEKMRIATTELARLQRTKQLRRITRSTGEIQWATPEELRQLARQKRERKKKAQQRLKHGGILVLGCLLLGVGLLFSRQGIRQARERSQQAARELVSVIAAETPAMASSIGEAPRLNSSDSSERPSPAPPRPPSERQPSSETSSRPPDRVPLGGKKRLPSATASSGPSNVQAVALIDVFPPHIEWIEVPESRIARHDVRFRFQATNEDATFAFFLDGVEEVYSDYVDTNVKSYTGLPDGTYTFYLKARDRAGNVVRRPLMYTFTIDTTPPRTRIVTGPTGTIAQRTVTFRFEADEPATFSSRLAGYENEFSEYTSETSRTFHNLPDGAYRFLLRARDLLGNEGDQPLERRFVIDTTAPNARIVLAPEPITSQREVQFQFEANADATFAWYLEGVESDFGPFKSQAHVTYTDLPDGEYTFRVKARDTVGNEDPAPASYTFRVDTQPPQVLITRSPRGTIPYSDVTFLYRANEPATFSTYLEGYDPGFSEFTPEQRQVYDYLPDGTYTFHVRARDRAGNLSLQEATQTFTIRTTETVYRGDFEDPKQKLLAGDENAKDGRITWGYTTRRSHTGKRSLWCAAVGNQGEAYAKNMNAWLEIPLDLTLYSGATLRFWYYLDTTEDETDQLLVSVHPDSEPDETAFKILWRALPTPEERPRWREQAISLDAYVGQAIRLRFYFLSDDQGQDEGAYLDSIEVIGRF